MFGFLNMKTVGDLLVLTFGKKRGNNVKNLKLRTKLFLISAVSTLMAALLCVVGYIGIDETDSSSRSISSAH